MRILINYTGRNGAGPSYAYEMAKGFIANGVEVYAIISSSVSNLAAWQGLSLKKLLIIDTYQTKKEFIKATIGLLLWQRKRIKKILRDVGLDAIYVPMQTYWSFIISKIFPGVPVYFTLHDPKAHSGESLFNRLFYKVTKYEVTNAHRVILLSKIFRRYVQEHFGKNEIIVIPHGAFWEYKLDSGNTPIVKYDNGKINFLFFGRIEEYKGIGILLQAYEEIEKKYADKVSLVIAGKGNMAEYNSNIARLKNVTVLNYMIPDNHIRDLFAGDDIVTVLPYKDATQSGVVPTAEMFGSLIVASKTGGLMEQLLDGKLGVMFENGNVQDLTIKMSDIVEHYKNYAHYIKVGRDYIESLDWPNLAKIVINDMRKDTEY